MPDAELSTTPSPTASAADLAQREKRRVALTSVAAAVLLTGLKLVVGLTTGSLGLLAEAAHSGLDLVAAIITYFAVRVSDKPADAEHLYGHGKVENLSALAETLLLLLTCGWIVYEAVGRLLFKDVPVHATAAAFVVMAISIVVDISRSRALRRVARKYNSQALEADALHFSTDVWSSCVVLIGLIGVGIGHAAGQAALWAKADSAAALLVALIVVWVSVQLGRRTVDGLLDRAPTGMAAAVEQAVRQVAGVLACPQIRLRQSGNQTFVDLIVGVRRGLSLESSHQISAAAEARIRALMPNADVVVHVEPLSGRDETLAERIRAIAANEGQAVHNVLLSEEAGRVHVELHLETNPQLDLRRAHDDADRLEAAIGRELPQVAGVTTHIEPRREGQEAHTDVTDASASLIASVQQIVMDTAGVEECHNIVLREARGDRLLSMHCTFAAGLSVRDVHDISTELETRLRAAIPNLVRVTTHPEPAGS